MNEMKAAAPPPTAPTYPPDPLPVGEPPGKPRPESNEFGGFQQPSDPLIGGGPISGRVDDTERGTLCVFCRDAAGAVYALTCEHVLSKINKNLDADGNVTSDTVAKTPTAGETRVGQVNPDGTWCHTSNDSFGVFATGDFTADHTWRDMALVKLDPATSYLPEIQQGGVVRGIAPTPTAAEITARGYLVRKYGNATGLTGGCVVQAQTAAGSTEPNTYVVLPHPLLNTSYDKVHFAVEGDSGAPVFTADGHLLGMITGVRSGLLSELYQDIPPAADMKVNYALLAAINAVLPQLARATPPLTVTLVTATQSGVVLTAPPAPKVVALLDDDLVTMRMPPPGVVPAGPPPPADRLRAELSATTLGREVLEMWRRHGTELYQLVNFDRRVMSTWYRSGASAVFQRLARARGRDGPALPRTVNGVPLRDCLDRMRAVLSERGGDELRAALAELNARLPDLAGLSYPRLLAALDTEPDRPGE